MELLVLTHSHSDFRALLQNTRSHRARCRALLKWNAQESATLATFYLALFQGCETLRNAVFSQREELSKMCACEFLEYDKMGFSCQVQELILELY